MAPKAGGRVVAVALGNDVGPADRLKGLAHHVVRVQGPNLDPYSADSWVEALADVLARDQPRLVLFGESPRTRELLPRLAARLESVAITNGLDIEWSGGGYQITRPVEGGKAYATYACPERMCLAAFRPNSFAIQAGEPLATTTETVEVDVAESRVVVLERTAPECRRVDLTEAQTVVAGGRGLRSPENLKLLEDLADALGAAIGVSRAVVDAGWADHAIQVGKSGKTISPALYIVAGVSGAVHHTMGMDTANVVVAVNTDPRAPIFQYADYGIVGDAMQVLPAITDEIRKRQGTASGGGMP